MTNSKLRMYCTLDENGYGYATRGFIQALATIGIDAARLRVIPAIACSRARPMIDDEPWLHPYVTGPWEGDEQVNIVFLNPALVGTYHTTVGGRYNIAITNWETDQLPKKTYDRRGETRSAVMDLNDYDEIWVPTRFVAGVLHDSGVTAPVYVIPHALTEELLAWPVKGGGKVNPETVFEFYHLGAYNARKAPDLLLRAYWKTGWCVSDAVRLRLHLISPDRSRDVVEQHANYVLFQLRSLQEVCSVADPPQMAPCTLPVNYAEICNLHHNAHCFATMSRGEGACLPALEAAALGNFVLGGGGPALDDLAELAPSTVALLPRRRVPITPMPEVRGYELDQEWYETAVEDMTAEMRAVVAFAREEGMPPTQEAEAVRDIYSPGAVGRRIKERLQAIGL